MTTRLRSRRAYLALSVAAAAALTLGACSGGTAPDAASDGGTVAGAQTGAGAGEGDGPVVVEFWHSASGDSDGPTLDALAEEFNAAHEGEIEVKPIFEGKYDDLIAKYKAAAQTGATPTMAQIYEIGTAFMKDSGMTVPVQKFIDAEGYDVSDLWPNIAGYYEIEDQLWSMPFSTSVPLFYYNKDIFRQAGLDPDNPPTTLAGIREAAQTIKDQGLAEYGFSPHIYGWFIEQEAAANGELYCDSDNGRSGTPRAMTFDGPGTVEFVTWWRDMLADGLAGSMGRDSDANKSGFASGVSAMTLESSGALSSIKAAATFEVGVGFFPAVADSEYGPAIGGNSLWISGEGHSEAEQAAAWEFIKFLASPKAQTTWHIVAGTVPVSKAAMDDPDGIAFRQEYPEYDVAIQQLEKTSVVPATQGCAAGVMPQSRQAVEAALEEILVQGGDPQESLTAAAQEVTGLLTEYNEAAGQ
jgi:sn-glycerol 3-phosphate transport system substrate-binding protein